jgi:hypothetical protein
MAKKSASAGTKKSHRKPQRSWSAYINRSLRALSKLVKTVNSLVLTVYLPHLALSFALVPPFPFPWLWI